ncbi:hypothetical protein [Bordetella sp. 02P26C-1]|uniref:hypothetical protein n=1 Tax=Bordetella sp. 02P26C-1 TaxID=2683195 RepID=UPI001354FDF7|nr:hypothetical protein [Bordetella sp. 02P26C-1]MVW80690.1 hypothetical protein [Bordetella sp. 02P26C-1]
MNGVFWKNFKAELVKQFAPDDGLPRITLRQAAPLLIGALVFMLVGYALFFASWLMEYPPNDSAWIAEWTERIDALRMVDRVAVMTGLEPMPMKVVVLYLFPGAILLTAWGMLWSVRPSILKTVLLRAELKKIPMWKSILVALFIPLFALLAYDVINHDYVGPTLSRRTVLLYASTFASATQILVFTAVPALYLAALIPVCVRILSTSLQLVRRRGQPK